MEMHINIGIIAAWIGVLSTIIGAVITTYNVIIKHLDKYLEKKLAPLDAWNKRQQNDINLAAERDAIMMEAQLVSLEAIHEGKNNGNVTDAIGRLRQYMLRHSSKPSSYAKE